MGVTSFDRPRARPAPRVLDGHWLNGESARLELERVTLVVAVKPDCDGCRDFVASPLDALEGVDVVFVCATALEGDEWSQSRHPVIVAPALLAVLEVRWPPFYVLIDPVAQCVLTEGVVFGPRQVAAEIERFRRR